jgi:hypothetical protein|mmetsp:Transcript_67420/g.150462  ORF Transcript_67420/g.150462 Transcript_67420/m.150462 type:complete len:86 (-) Transcript_67420:11-268(-)
MPACTVQSADFERLLPVLSAQVYAMIVMAECDGQRVPSLHFFCCSLLCFLPECVETLSGDTSQRRVASGDMMGAYYRDIWYFILR